MQIRKMSKDMQMSSNFWNLNCFVGNFMSFEPNWYFLRKTIRILIISEELGKV